LEVKGVSVLYSRWLMTTNQWPRKSRFQIGDTS